MDEAAASILTAFTSTSRLTKASSLDTATTNSTCTLTNESVVSSSASSLADPNNDLIRFTVATKLKRISDADKLRKISSKGRSIKFPVKVSKQKLIRRFYLLTISHKTNRTNESESFFVSQS